MEHRIENIEAFHVEGMEREFFRDTALIEIPRFWDEYMRSGLNNKVCGCYGICFDSGGGTLRYMIGDNCYPDAEPHGGYIKRLIPAHTWAKFRATGALPGALQALNRRIFAEWLPQNGEYAMAEGIIIEMYTAGDTASPDYVSEIWIPVKKKQA